MPVILDPRNEEEWLDPELKDTVHLQKFFKPCPSSWLEAYEIAPLVNNSRNNTVDLLKPLKS
jgi:putative SOS response-associated peptidase YedK